MTERIEPADGRLVVRRVEAKRETAGGIVLPEQAVKPLNRGEVVGCSQWAAYGPGDIVLFDKFAGTEIEVNNETLLILDEEDVLGSIKVDETESEGASSV